MFENEASPEAHAVITQACRWVNKNSPVRHEFLVVDAEITGCKFWVRIDRFCNDGDGAAMQWEALDTVHKFFVGLMRTLTDFLHLR